MTDKPEIAGPVPLTDKDRRDLKKCLTWLSTSAGGYVSSPVKELEPVHRPPTEAKESENE